MGRSSHRVTVSVPVTMALSMRYALCVMRYALVGEPCLVRSDGNLRPANGCE